MPDLRKKSLLRETGKPKVKPEGLAVGRKKKGKRIGRKKKRQGKKGAQRRDVHCTTSGNPRGEKNVRAQAKFQIRRKGRQRIPIKTSFHIGLFQKGQNTKKLAVTTGGAFTLDKRMSG